MTTEFPTQRRQVMYCKSILKLVVAGAIVAAGQTDPKRPKAGKPFTAMIGIVNQETQDLVQSGTVRCPARIGRRGVRVARKLFVDGTGIAACTWVIPAKAGKRLIARVEVTSDEGFVKASFSKVIRP